jgi:rhodanese-related sulfurtransferase
VAKFYGIFLMGSVKLIFLYLHKYIYKMKEISVQELKEKIDNKEDFQLIDVRETFEYEVSNLDGENIPLGGILIEADKVAKDKPVIIQCRSGKRSAAAVMQLEQQYGFDNLYNLKGGILAWQEAFDPSMTVY